MKNKINVLFLGNSHTFVNFVPAILHDLFNEIGIEANCVMLTQGGQCLDFHAGQINTKYNVLHGNYDYVILQGKATNFNAELYLENGKQIYDKYISKTATKPITYMVWSNRGKKHEQAAITNANIELAKYMNGAIAPAGTVWQKLLRSRPAPELYQEDGNHATPNGSYLAATCIFYAITERERSIKIKDGAEPHTRLGIDTATAAKIHQVACKVTTSYRNGEY
jgi:hypothetical protein